MPAEDLIARVRRLCREGSVVAQARARTRFALQAAEGGIDADAVVHHLVLYAHRARVPDPEEPDRTIALLDLPDSSVTHELHEEAGTVLRRSLVTWLVEHHDLPAVAAGAAASLGVSERARQVAYCVVVLFQKKDPALTPRGGGPKEPKYRLDPTAQDFGERLRFWAGEVARNLAADAELYTTIHAEAMRFEVRTLRGQLRVPRHYDDIAARATTKIVEILLQAPGLEDVSLETAVAEGPGGSEFAFQSPLRRWIGAVAGHDPWIVGDPLIDGFEPVPARGSDEDPQTRRERERAELLARLVAKAREMADSRDALPDAVAAVADLLRRADAQQFSDGEDRRVWDLYRAELAAAFDILRRERGRFPAMLTYILLALRRSSKRQAIAVLSLRSAAVAAPVAAHIAWQMRGILRDGAPIVPALVVRTRAAQAAGVPGNRAAELERLRDDGRHRIAVFAEITALLEHLPPTVGDLASMAAAVPGGPMTVRAVAVTRGQAAAELGAVDRVFADAFRRFAVRTS